MRIVPLLMIAVALAGCAKKGADNKEAVRQGVVDYLSSRAGLNLKSMNVEVASVTFNGDQAEATVSFTPKGAASPAQGMSMKYNLQKKEGRWVVTGRSDAGQPHGMGAGAPGGMPNPHGQGAPGEMPGAGANAPTPADMPPGHPPAGGAGSKAGEKK